MRLTWDVRSFEDELDRGSIYLQNGGVKPWNGLISVNEKPVEVASRISHLDGVRVANERSEESFSATIEAFTYPDEVLHRRPFGLSYRTRINESHKIHLVYNVLARMTERTYAQDEATPFSFDISTRPVPIPGAKPGAHLIVDISKANSATIFDLENVLYGYESGQARLPLPAEVIELFDAHVLITVIDNGDGTFTVSGPDEVVRMLDDTTFMVDSPGIVYLDGSTYTVSSW